MGQSQSGTSEKVSALSSSSERACARKVSRQLTDSDLADSFEFDLASADKDEQQPAPKPVVRMYLNRNASESLNSSLVSI
jgi:hypothetical protein